MAEVMPINFPLPSESATVTYDWSDFGEGTGIKMFYLASTYGDNILTTNQIYANDVEYITGAKNMTADFVKNLDVDYDLSAFNSPRTVRGTAYINFTGHTWSVGGNCYWKFTVKVRKWDGATETEIGSATTRTVDGNAEGADAYDLFALSIPLTETHFAIGDVLRVTIEGYDKLFNANPTTNILIIGQDPMNRDGTYIIPSTDSSHGVSITQTKIWIPFKIEN
jgi:hypothetical protein